MMRRGCTPEIPFGKRGFETLMRWLVKTAVVLGFSEGGSRRFIETPTDVAVPDGGLVADSGFLEIATGRHLGQQIGGGTSNGGDLVVAP